MQWYNTIRSLWGSACCLSLILAQMWLKPSGFIHLRTSAPLLLKGACLAWDYLNCFFAVFVIPLMDIVFSLAWENVLPFWFIPDSHCWTFLIFLFFGVYGVLFSFLEHSTYPDRLVCSHTETTFSWSCWQVLTGSLNSYWYLLHILRNCLCAVQNPTSCESFTVS